MITGRFKELVTTIAYKKGIPNIRITYTPHPITDRPAELCRKYVAGNDPNTGQPMLEQIYAGLTKPLSEEDKKAGFLKRDARPRLLPPETADKLMDYFHEQGFTDGNPVILPTEKKVAEMLKATSRKPDEWVGQMRPSPPHEAWYYTVEMVAVNAVMAGAKPEYFPTILAIASKGLTSMFSSTSSFARMVVVNGPVVKEIGMNTGIGALGPGQPRQFLNRQVLDADFQKPRRFGQTRRNLPGQPGKPAELQQPLLPGNGRGTACRAGILCTCRRDSRKPTAS